MRDYIVIGIVLGSLPFCLFRPYIGILMWVWLGLMNPHRLAWGFAQSFPVAQVVALTTLAGYLFQRNKDKIPWAIETWVLVALLGLFTLTTIFSLVPDLAWEEWERVFKIFFMSFVAMLLFQDKQKLRFLLLVMGLSIGYFGVKGAIFTLLTGGQFIVFGPSKSFIEDNNALALAELMVIPILWFLAQEETRLWLKRALVCTAILCLVSVIFSYSRGAFLAMITLGLMFLWQTKYRVRFSLVILLVGCIGLMLVPDKWFDRMGTIQTFDEDRSAMGRINAWWFAYNVAVERPLLGGGFRVFIPELFERYAPIPEDVHDAHSIYFEILGEHGFLGLGLFMLLLAITFYSTYHVSRLARGIAGLEWVRNYALMLKFSLVAYAVGGAFLGLAYFDLFYYLVVCVVMLKIIVRNHLRYSSNRERLVERGKDPVVLRPVPALRNFLISNRLERF